MIKKIRGTLCLTIPLLIAGCAGTATSPRIPTETCAQTKLESTRLLCQSDSIRSKKVQYSLLGALGGAIVVGTIVASKGGPAKNGALAGAAVGGLVGYWLNQRNAIALENRSLRARIGELDARLKAAATDRRREVAALRKEIRRTRGLTDKETKRKTLGNIITANELSKEKFRNEGEGVRIMTPSLNIPKQRAPKQNPRDELANLVEKEACDALVDIGENCRFIS